MIDNALLLSEQVGMSQTKVEFIGSLQNEVRTLHPSEISQRIREKYAWVCLYRADPDLDPNLYRGYMVRPYTGRAHSAEDPAGYWCIIAGSQTIGWQNLVWTKEMLQALDPEHALTSDSDKLRQVIEMGEVHEPHDSDTDACVVADKNGFTLALGCAIPRAYREKLRKEIQETGKLDPLERANMENYIPAEYVDSVLGPGFEDEFNRALDETNLG